MRVAVMGAGAVGCYYGAMLARAGHSVTLIGRAQHVEAIGKKGLLLETQTLHEHIPLQASTEASSVRGAQLLLFCVKSTDTQSAGEAIAPHLATDATVLSMQNGVDNAERLEAVLGFAVLPTVVYVAAEMAGPGHVKHHGRGELILAASPKSETVATLFTEAGIPCAVSENAAGALWGKLIVNCAYNALSAVARLPYGELSRGPGVTDVMNDVVEECLAVSRKMGITIAGNIREAVAATAKTMANQYSSTAQDLARGKPSEIDYLNGYVVRKGKELGIATPVNRLLHTMVKLIETRPR